MGMLDISAFSNNAFYNSMPSANIMNVEKQPASNPGVKAQPVVLNTVSFATNKAKQVKDKPDNSEHIRELLKKLNERDKQENHLMFIITRMLPTRFSAPRIQSVRGRH